MGRRGLNRTLCHGIQRARLRRRRTGVCLYGYRQHLYTPSDCDPQGVIAPGPDTSGCMDR
ncbi:hypothetical protein NSERUTF1_6151 [Nocardia seriolae]|nr:hypothetical protein NSERUTF1_6151 [Nocardia seriolae]